MLFTQSNYYLKPCFHLNLLENFSNEIFRLTLFDELILLPFFKLRTNQNSIKNDFMIHMLQKLKVEALL